MAYDKELDEITKKLYEAGVNAANHNKLMEDMVRTGKAYGPGYKPATEAKAKLNDLLRRVEVAERGRFIEDDRAGRNAVYIAKQKQLYFHDHEFDLTSFMCSCGISKVEAETLDKLTVAELKALKGRV